MAVFIFRNRQFMKTMAELRKAGGKALQVADRVEAITRTLAASERVIPQEMAPHTKYGEARIAGGGKFDLGSGYRLVYLKKGGHLIILYVGTHDDCDCWIRNNRDIDPFADAECRRVTPGADRESETPPPGADLEAEPDYDDILMKNIDEKTLRRVFSGLCGKSGGS